MLGTAFWTCLSVASAALLMPPSEESISAAINHGENLNPRIGIDTNFATAPNPESLGVDKVKQQSGYLRGPSGNNLFYWFFESRRNSATDAVVIWLNGGPGCSSLEATLFENGPSTLTQDNKLVNNTYSWNNVANVLYIDNPAGVGYSTDQQPISDTVTASADFVAAVREFFERNPQFAKNKLHMTGESYAGRYIPVFAEAINADPGSPVKVASVMIGNGLVDPVAEYSAYEPMLCGQGGRPQALSDQACEELQAVTPQCVNAVQECMNNNNRLVCGVARLNCNAVQATFRGRNPYDIRDQTCAQSSAGLCYPQLDTVQAYYRQADVQSALGVAPNSDGSAVQFQICNNQMNTNFYAADDPYQPTFENVTNLLNQGVPVLAYNGDADIILNWLGGRQWTQNLQWGGQADFQAAGRSPRDWMPEGPQGKKRGEVTNAQHFTFLRVADAGHMVPFNQPLSSLYMLESWIDGDYAFTRQFRPPSPPTRAGDMDS